MPAVPAIIGLLEADAIAAIESANLSAGQRGHTANEADAGVVVAQSPVAGTNVAAAFAVAYVVSDGPSPSPPAAIDFVTLDEAAAHVREVLDGMPADKLADLELKIGIACATILDYLKDRGDPTWDTFTVPRVVKAAALTYLALIWEHRGDDETQNTNFDAMAWEGIDRLLKRSRDPALR